ncbi:hypothetical protein F4810DRAFT_709597 [Camillea tinctor]|nr:hypothetical protein F4810DRAFT_709597 [Camillea tinctor]
MPAAPSRGPSRGPSSSSRPPQTPSQTPSSTGTALLSRIPSRAPSSSAPTIPSSSARPRPRPSASGLLSAVPEHDETPLLSAAIPTAEPSGLRSVYSDPEDLRRASMQSSYATLAPAERASQDEWATRKASEFAPCPYDFAWKRHHSKPGYACVGGAHFMSDAILAEGIPGLYATMDVHRGLDECDRRPPVSEQIPPGYWGPVRPVGLDDSGNFTYFRNKVDQIKSKNVDSTIADVLGWEF